MLLGISFSISELLCFLVSKSRMLFRKNLEDCHHYLKI